MKPARIYVQFGKTDDGAITLRRFQTLGSFEGSIPYIRADLAKGSNIVAGLHDDNRRLLEQVWALTRERDQLAERLARA